MKNKIEMKESHTVENNVQVIDVFVNDVFYTAIIGIKFGIKMNNEIHYHRKYRFIHDELNSLIQSDEYSDRLFNSLKNELLNLDNDELTNLLFWE